MLLIMDVTKSRKWEYADLDHFISKQNYYLWQIFKIFDKMIMLQKLFCRFQ